jgi:hypothetical protein
MTNAGVSWLGGLFGAVFCVLAHAQEPTPPPEVNVSPTPETPVLPETTPEPIIPAVPSPPESAAPELLPETNALPQPRNTPAPNPRDLIPGGLVPRALVPPSTESSAAQKLKDAIRFREIRTLAERDPYAISLWYYAGRAVTFDDRRQYLRLYYHYLGARMRKLEPRLSALISNYELGQISLMTQAGIRPTIPLRELDKRDKARMKEIGALMP